MEFLVKLIEVTGTKDGEAREDLYANCTHVAKDFWLFEGDLEALHEGIEFSLAGEESIKAHGGLTSSEIKKMVIDIYNIDRAFIY